MSTHPDERGVARQDHYGQGRQPWDDILDNNWAPEVCAGMVLKYLRRSKEPGHSLESARWYYARLLELTRAELLSRASRESERARRYDVGRACGVLVRLQGMLTTEERRKVS